MFTQLALVLGLKIMLSQSVAVECQGVSNLGCYDTERHVMYVREGDYMTEFAKWHEMGHAIFTRNEWARYESKIVIKDFEPYYETGESLDERAANYYAEYKTNKYFGNNYPCLYIYFMQVENMLLPN